MGVVTVVTIEVAAFDVGMILSLALYGGGSVDENSDETAAVRLLAFAIS